MKLAPANSSNANLVLGRSYLHRPEGVPSPFVQRQRQQQQQQQQLHLRRQQQHSDSPSTTPGDDDDESESSEEEEDDEDDSEFEDSEARSLRTRKNCCVLFKEEEDCTCCEVIFPCWCKEQDSRTTSQASSVSRPASVTSALSSSWSRFARAWRRRLRCCCCCRRFGGSPGPPPPLEQQQQQQHDEGQSCLVTLIERVCAVRECFCDMVEFRENGKEGAKWLCKGSFTLRDEMYMVK